jgi:hypothetical protein
MTFDQTPGRFLRFLVIDERSTKVLGFLSISNDFSKVKGRDEWIGWNQEHSALRMEMLNHSAVASCIAPTQPFGFNFLGGKLMALLAVGSVVQETWKSIHGYTLVGMTTTSLYGSFSMYNSLGSWWKRLPATKGRSMLSPSKRLYGRWHEYIREAHGPRYEQVLASKREKGPVTNARNKVLGLIVESAGLRKKDFENGFERGLYYSLILREWQRVFSWGNRGVRVGFKGFI